MYFDHTIIDKYKNGNQYYDSLDNYILNFPKIIKHLLNTDETELLEWICKEHSPDYPYASFPHDIISIILSRDYEFGWYNEDLVESVLWDCLYAYGYKFYDFDYSNHYIIKQMKSYASCSICFGLDPDC